MAVSVFPTNGLDQWKDITGVYDGSFMKLYVGGVVVDSISHSCDLVEMPTTHRPGKRVK